MTGAGHWCFAVTEGKLQFLHVTGYEGWTVVDFKALRVAGKGIMLAPTGEPQHLLLHRLTHLIRPALNHGEILLCCQHLPLEGVPATTRDELFRKIAVHFGDEEGLYAEFTEVDKALRKTRTKRTSNTRGVRAERFARR